MNNCYIYFNNLKNSEKKLTDLLNHINNTINNQLKLIYIISTNNIISSLKNDNIKINQIVSNMDEIEIFNYIKQNNDVDIKNLYLNFDFLNETVIYYLIDNFNMCFNLLNSYLAVGVGNNKCWWSTSNHMKLIKTKIEFLNPEIKDSRFYFSIKSQNIDIIKNKIKNTLQIKDYIINRNIYGIYFICCIGNYLEIVSEQIDKLITSGLYNQSKNIYCFVCLQTIEIINLLSKFDKLIIIGTDKNLYEKYAINNFKKYISGEYYLYYIHTKSVTRSEKSYTDWRRICEHFTINKWKLNLELLKFYDCTGIKLSNFPKKHFSGNFWWSTSENLNKLLDINDKYLSPEMYVCSNIEVNCVSLYQDFICGGSEYDHKIYSNKSDLEILNNISIIPDYNEWVNIFCEHLI